MLTSSVQHQRKQETLRTFHERVEYYTAQGHNTLPSMVRELRTEYFQDFNFLLDTLARLGIELKSYPSKFTLYFVTLYTLLIGIFCCHH